MISQAVATSRVARRNQAVTILGSIVPFPIVEATFTPKRKAATKLKKAAQSTASLGVRTRVETTVAIELAASWKPFMKSKNNATRTTSTTIAKGTMTDDKGFSGIRSIPGCCRESHGQRHHIRT